VSHRKALPISIGAGLCAFLVYLLTLAPTITWRNNGVDSGDLAAAVAIGGVPHPPGYPTYLLLAEAFKWLPVGDVAYRLNLLSATCAALTIVFLSLIIHQTLSTTFRGADRQIIGACALSAALTLAFSTPFWSQAIITEVYALHSLLTVLLLWLALQITPANQAWLRPLLFGVWGVSLGNHLSILFLLPLLLWASPVQWYRREGLAAGAATVVGLAVYGLLPWRAGAQPPINWGGVTTWPNFWWLVSAAPYRHFVFTLPATFIPSRILATISLLAETFLWVGLPLALCGWWQHARHARSLAYGSLVSAGLIVVYAIGYNTTDSDVYLLPAYLFFAVWLGWGLYQVAHRWSLKYSRALILLPLIAFFLNISAQNLRADYEAYDYAHRSLTTVQPKAIIITETDAQAFALWYGRYGLGLRPDVAIVHSHLLPYAWYRQTLQQHHPYLQLATSDGQPIIDPLIFIEQNVARTPIYLAKPKNLHPVRYNPSERRQAPHLSREP